MHKFKSIFLNKKSDLELWFSQLQLSSLDFIRYASFFCIGFIAGLIFKKWSKYIVFVAVIVSIALAILHGFSFITINFGVIQKTTGFQNINTFSDFCIVAYERVQKYSWELCCSGLGFIVGFKTG